MSIDEIQNEFVIENELKPFFLVDLTQQNVLFYFQFESI